MNVDLQDSDRHLCLFTADRAARDPRAIAPAFRRSFFDPGVADPAASVLLRAPAEGLTRMKNVSSLLLHGLSASLILCLAAPTLRAQEPGGPAPAADSTPAPPDPPAETQESFFRSTELGALVDAYYDFYSTRPAGNALFRNFDTKHNQFAFSMAQVWIAKPASADSRTGFKVKFNFGPASTLVNAYEPGENEFIQNVEEGYLSYLAPLGKGLQIDVGKFVTQHGAEVIEAKDDWNYSRSLLFALAIPYYHSGVRLTYPLNGKVTVMGTIVNGWNNVVENNSGKTLGAQIAVKPIPALSIVQNYMAGPEQTSNNDDWRQLSDTIATWTVTPAFSVMANYDYGKDTAAGVPVHWQGIAGYAKLQARKWLAVSPRFEWYDDPSGFTTGAPQTLKEVTGTFELKPSDALVWRIEYRHDFSDSPVFETGSGAFKKTQSSIGFGVLYSFSTKG
jgi:putative OmpL-like beta-barrel porin-2